ncbi:MAG: hemerythrin family protein [Pseudomonadota bacterium]|nr:hemerythrin family protein [Pseudomonadota bacterium]
MIRDWSDEYLTGIAEIDGQHQGFFEAAHRLYDQILNCEGEHGVEEAVIFLRDYAERHFQTEEAFMREHEFPLLEEHKKLHDAFFESLELLVDELQVFGSRQHLADRALDVAQDWLIDHIAEEDMQYAMHVRRRHGTHSATGRTGSN